MGSVINSSVSARMTTSATSLGSSQGAGGGDFGDNTDRTNEVGTTGGRRIVEDDDELNVTVRDGTGRGLNGSGNSRQRTPIDTDAMERFWFPSVTEWYANLDKRNAATVVVLVYCNLINYMDRSTVAGMIEYIRNDESFAITSDKTLGLLQTAFVVFYTFTAPLFGYLGDRYPRKWIVGLGLTVWSLATLAGSFCTNFWLFMFFRAVVGVGEASYSTIAPAIISDLFVSDSRSKVLALFYFAVPVGTGLGYMVGSEVGQAAEDWRWGLRVTPFMGLLAVLLIVFVMTDPPRGGSEGGANLQAASDVKEDLMSLKRNKSFCLSTILYVRGILRRCFDVVGPKFCLLWSQSILWKPTRRQSYYSGRHFIQIRNRHDTGGLIGCTWRIIRGSNTPTEDTKCRPYSVWSVPVDGCSSPLLRVHNSKI